MSEHEDTELHNDDVTPPQPPPVPPKGEASGALDDERGLPSVNARRDENNKGKIMGMAALAVLGIILLVMAWLPKGDQAKEPAQEDNDTEIVNRLPSMPGFRQEDSERPAPPPPPPSANKPPAPSSGAQEGLTAAEQRKKQRQQQRRMAPIIAYNTSGASSTNKQGSAAAGAHQELSMLQKLLGNYGTGTGPATSGGLTGASIGGSSLGNSLEGTATPLVHARLLQDRNFLITKGTFLDCALETAIDTTVSGFTSCRITHNIYSDNGNVLLLERGSRIVGEYQTQQVRPGMNRIFVLWTRVETPNGVVVNLDSPGIGPLGKSGIEGQVDSHFLQRFGAALMLSVFNDVASYQTAKARGGGDSINFGGTMSQSQRLAEIALKNSIDIPPTLYINQGAHIKVYVARDIDFSTVYRLKAKHPQAVASSEAMRADE